MVRQQARNNEEGRMKQVFFGVSIACVGQFRDGTHACGDEVNREMV